MEKHPITCARCGADVSRDKSAGLTYCSACGTGLSRTEREREICKQEEVRIASPRAELDPDTQIFWKGLFWLSGIAAPVGTVLLYGVIQSILSLDQTSDEITIAVVALVIALMPPSLCLSKLYTRPQSTSGVILSTVGIALGLASGLCVVLFSILYAGCGP